MTSGMPSAPPNWENCRHPPPVEGIANAWPRCAKCNLNSGTNQTPRIISLVTSWTGQNLQCLSNDQHGLLQRGQWIQRPGPSHRGSSFDDKSLYHPYHRRPKLYSRYWQLLRHRLWIRPLRRRQRLPAVSRQNHSYKVATVPGFTAYGNLRSLATPMPIPWWCVAAMKCVGWWGGGRANISHLFRIINLC